MAVRMVLAKELLGRRNVVQRKHPPAAAVKLSDSPIAINRKRRNFTGRQILFILITINVRSSSRVSLCVKAATSRET